jgi:hypothetical protein
MCACCCAGLGGADSSQRCDPAPCAPRRPIGYRRGMEWLLIVILVALVGGAVLLVLRGRRPRPEDAAYRELRDREEERLAPRREAEERALRRAREDAERRVSVD